MPPMDRRDFSKATMGGVAAALQAQIANSGPKRPNLILFMTDELRAESVACSEDTAHGSVGRPGHAL
jgi:hypothetical protein